MPYDLSDSIPIAVDVKDAAGAPANATSVVLTITLPDGTTTTPAVTNPPTVTGQYRYTHTATVEGRHTWRFVTTSPNTAYQDVFEIREAATPALLSLADAKAHLNITGTSNDDELREYLEAITGIVEEYVGPIVRRTYTRRVMGGRSRIALPHRQVAAVTAVTLVWDGSSLDLTDLTIDTPSGIIGRKAGWYLPYGASLTSFWELDVTYKVGRSYVQPNWTLAAKIILKHNWETQLGNLPSIQGEDLVDPRLGTGYVVPFRAVALLQPDTVSVGFA